MKPEVIFLPIANASEKIERVLATVHRHFDSNKTLMIFVSDQKSADYLDKLLWRVPAESFLPHQVCDEECQDRIVITRLKRNLNHAKIALNLTQEICPDHDAFEKIYELFDAQKSLQCKEKRERYQTLGFIP